MENNQADLQEERAVSLAPELHFLYLTFCLFLPSFPISI